MNRHPLHDELGEAILATLGPDTAFNVVGFVLGAGLLVAGVAVRAVVGRERALASLGQSSSGEPSRWSGRRGGGP